MAWYWQILIILGIFIIIGIINASNESYDEEATSNAMNRLTAMVIIDNLKYERPETWAKCASNILGRPVDPPTQEQIARWKMQNKK